jgi:sugar O-acyltransferase (sialic acid O-acetyltransferase NeuD family)
MKESIILVGAGGHARACIDVIQAQGRYSIAGLIDTADRVGSSILGYQVVGTDEDLASLASKYEHFLVTVGHIKTAAVRDRLFQQLTALSVSMPVIMSPTAYVSKHAHIGNGTIVMHGAVVNAGAHVGRNCIINTGAIVEHDTLIGDSCHISTAAVLNGGCSLGDSSFIGSHSTVREGVQIGAEVVVGAHSCVVKDCEAANTYFGVPARPVEK